jgi:hypothetical protein
MSGRCETEILAFVRVLGFELMVSLVRLSQSAVRGLNGLSTGRTLWLRAGVNAFPALQL